MTPQPTRKLIIETARRELGTRWVHQGRAPKKGLDCLGLIVVTGTQLGYTVQDQTDYLRNPDSKRLIEECKKQLEVISLEEAREGDILTFFFTESKRPYHFAIMTSKTTMIHAYGTAKCVVEHSIDEYWLERRSYAFRFPGIV